MRNPEMTFRSFVYNLILIVAMVLGCAYAAREGMLSAIAHMDEIQAHVERRAGR